MAIPRSETEKVPYSAFLLQAVGDDDSDRLSVVSSVGDEIFQEQPETWREEAEKLDREREAEEVANRLRGALQESAQLPHRAGNETSPNLKAAYKEIHTIAGSLNTLGTRMSAQAEEVLRAQNLTGRRTDMICDKIASTLRQAVANANTYTSRIEKLMALREEERKKHLDLMYKMRADYMAKQDEAKKDSEQEWKTIAAKLKDAQDDSKGTKQIGSMMQILDLDKD